MHEGSGREIKMPKCDKQGKTCTFSHGVVVSTWSFGLLGDSSNLSGKSVFIVLAVARQIVVLLGRGSNPPKHLICL